MLCRLRKDVSFPVPDPEKAFDRSGIEEKPEYQEFVKENAFWLEDYSLYMAVKDSLGAPAS